MSAYERVVCGWWAFLAFFAPYRAFTFQAGESVLHSETCSFAWHWLGRSFFDLSPTTEAL